MPTSWEGRFAELVRRLTASREGSALEVLPDLMPVLPVVHAADPEHHLMRRERLCAGHLTQGAVAAQYPSVALANRSTNIVAVVEGLQLYSSTNPHIARWEPMLAWVGAGYLAGTACYGDTRGLAGGNQVPQCTLESSTVVALTTLRYGRQVNAGGQNAQLADRIILAPGTALLVQVETVNISVTVMARWRERAVDSAELSPTGA